MIGSGQYRQWKYQTPTRKLGNLLHQHSASNKIIFSNELRQTEWAAIGVQYDPSNERGNYVPTTVSLRYDAFIFIDHTTVLRPLGTPARNKPPDTYRLLIPSWEK